MNSEPLRLGSRKSPMAVSQSGDVARLVSLLAALEAGCSAPVGAYAIQTGVDKLHLEGVVLGLPASSFPSAVLDSTSGFGRMVVRERGEADVADAVSLGHELAARMLALGAADVLRAGNTDGNEAHD